MAKPVRFVLLGWTEAEIPSDYRSKITAALGERPFEFVEIPLGDKETTLAALQKAKGDGAAFTLVRPPDPVLETVRLSTDVPMLVSLSPGEDSELSEVTEADFAYGPLDPSDLPEDEEDEPVAEGSAEGGTAGGGS